MDNPLVIHALSQFWWGNDSGIGSSDSSDSCFSNDDNYDVVLWSCKDNYCCHWISKSSHAVCRRHKASRHLHFFFTFIVGWNFATHAACTSHSGSECCSAGGVRHSSSTYCSFWPTSHTAPSVASSRHETSGWQVCCFMAGLNCLH